MKPKHFRKIEGFDEVLEILETGICEGVCCGDCPFGVINNLKYYGCWKNYTTTDTMFDVVDERLIKSAKKFKKMVNKWRWKGCE